MTKKNGGSRRPVRRRALASPEDAAAALGFSRSVVYALLRAQALPASRIGKRFWISRKTIRRIIDGELRLSMTA
jgi:excisionase family DNA binding protein